MTKPAAPLPPPTWRDRMSAQVADVGFLRHLWHNFAPVAPGVYRSNHPGDRRLVAYAARHGIRAVVNLRGDAGGAPQRIEAAACARLGLAFASVAMSARSAPRPEALLHLLDLFDTLPRPFLMHCKSGADRAGLASALYLLHREGASVATARAHLSWRFLHVRGSRTGILDGFLDAYEAALADGPVPIRDWIAKGYDRRALLAAHGRVAAT